MIVKQETIDRLKMANEVIPHFEKGDKVLCIDDKNADFQYQLCKNKIYTIEKFIGDEIVLVEIWGYSFKKERFIKTTNEIDLLMYKIGYENLGL